MDQRGRPWHVFASGQSPERVAPPPVPRLFLLPSIAFVGGLTPKFKFTEKGTTIVVVLQSEQK
eukprot:398046-Amphidinium_carterae.1